MPAPTKKAKTVKTVKATKTTVKKSVSKPKAAAPSRAKTAKGTAAAGKTTTKRVAKPAVKAAKSAAPKGAAAKPKVSASKKTAVKVKKENAVLGLPEKLRDAALKVLDDRQAENVVTVSLQGISPLADYVVIASGRSGRQLAAISEYLREAFLKVGIRKVRIEGLPQADWVLIDAGDVLIHLFRPEVRNYYKIEDIWTSVRSA